MIPLLLAAVGVFSSPAGAEGSLPLAQVLARARAQHPRITSARRVLARARADARAAHAPFFPEVTATTSWEVTEDDYGASTTRTEDLERISASVSQRLFDFGRTRGEVLAARARVSAAAANAATAESNVALAVTEAYVQAVLAERLLDLRQRTLRDRESLRHQVERLVDSGVRPRSDLARAEIDRENARLDLVVAEAEAISSRHRLRDAAGVLSLPTAPLEGILEDLPALPEGEDLADSAPDRRPEVRAARAVVRAAEEDVRAARRDRLPVLSASAAYLSRDRSIDRVGQPGLAEWSAGVSFGWDGFNWLSADAAIEGARADLEKARAEVEDLDRQVRIEVLLARQSLAEALVRVEVFQAVTGVAAENHRLIRRRYEAGAATILDVTDAQVRLTEAEAGVLRARADAWIASARLERRAGTAW